MLKDNCALSAFKIVHNVAVFLSIRVVDNVVGFKIQRSTTESEASLILFILIDFKEAKHILIVTKF